MIKKVFAAVFTLYTIFRIDIYKLSFLKYLFPLLGLLVLLNSSFAERTGIRRNKIINIIVILFFCLFICILSPVLHKTRDFSYINVIITMFGKCLWYVFLIFVLYKLYGSRLNLNLFFKIFINACILYVFTTFLFIVFPALKDFWFNNVLVMTETELRKAYAGGAYTYRVGIAGFSAFGFATIFGVALLINTYLLLQKNMKRKEFGYRIFAQIIIIIGCFLYGRITIVAFVLCGIYILIFSPDKKRLFKIFLTLSIILAIGISFLFVAAQTNEGLNEWVKWSFNVLTDLIQGNEINDGSVNILFNKMYFMPPLKTLLIGDGYYTCPDDGKYYMHTDVGFLRLVLYFGIFGLLTAYVAFIKTVLLPVKRFKAEKNLQGIILMYFILIAVFVFELKGETVIAKMPLMLIMPLIQQMEISYETTVSGIIRKFTNYGRTLCLKK